MHHHYHEAIQMETTRVKTWKRLNDRFVHVVLSLPSNPMHNDLLYVAPVYCKILLYPCNMWRTCILNIHCMWGVWKYRFVRWGCFHGIFSVANSLTSCWHDTRLCLDDSLSSRQTTRWVIPRRFKQRWEISKSCQRPFGKLKRVTK